MNTELMLKVAAAIEANPERFTMADWDNDIAALASELSGDDTGGTVQVHGARVLGLEHRPSWSNYEPVNVPLFFEGDWPDAYQGCMDDLAANAVRLLRDMVAGEVETSDADPGSSREWWAQFSAVEWEAA